MLDRIVNSWQLVKASLQVLRGDKELLVFPLVSAVGVILVSIVFLLPLIWVGSLEGLVDRTLGETQFPSYGLLFLFYLSQYFIILFSNSALVAAASLRLEGGDPTLIDGYQGALRRLGPIAGYALIAATVGVLLRALARRRRGLGRLLIALIGAAWNLATFLVVPVLVLEGLGPVAAIRRSVGLLRRTWGEQIAGNLSLSLVFGSLLILVSLLVLAPFIYLAIELSPAYLLIALLLLVAFYLAMALVYSTLNGIFTAAVYRYATTGDAGAFFEPQVVQAAFRPA